MQSRGRLLSFGRRRRGTVLAGGGSRAPFGPDFHRFWVASAVSNLGDGVRLTALPLLALQVTDNEIGIAAVTALITVPWLVAGPLGGVAVDRLDRRRLMMVAQAGRAAAVAVLAATVMANAAPLWLVYAVTLIVGVGEVLVDTASQASVPMLAPPGPDGLERANGRLGAAQTLLDQIVGAPLGAALFVVGAGLPFAFDAASFALAALLLATISTPLQPERAPRPDATLRADVAEGLATVWNTPVLRGLAVSVGLFNTVLGASFAVLVILLVDELDGSPAAYGLVLSAGAVGGFLGALVAVRIVRRLGRPVTIVAATALAGAATGAMGVAPAPVVIGVLLFAATGSVVVFNVVSQSVRQAVTPPGMLGRVVASFRMISMAGAPAGAVLGGVGASLFGVRSVYSIAGVFCLVPVFTMVGAARHLPPAEPVASTL